MSLDNNTPALVQAIEQGTGLRVLRVSSPEQLETLLSNGLAQLYKDVFAKPPYDGKLELDETWDILRDIQAKDGIILVAQDPKARNRPVAFAASVPLRMEPDLAKIAKEYYVDSEEAAYFAGDGVADDYRRCCGLSEKMKQLLLEANAADGLQKVLMRTRMQNYAQINAFNKSGGNILRSQSQKTLRKTITGETVVDNNLFYLFNRAAKKETSRVLDRVIVVSTDKGNRAFVFGTKYGRFWNWSLTEDLKWAYPDIRKVVYVCSRGLDKVAEGKVLFDATMYINASISSRSSDSAGSGCCPH